MMTSYLRPLCSPKMVQASNDLNLKFEIISINEDGLGKK